ncbi:hypothetical protein NAV33_02115 [Pseudomonas stutzeri]|uniref:BRO-N domain-containing protein n=1 Tax=Stutzerimonas stutzeri TaxID=316 RepID=UPI00210B9391|nr:BRO family protein [Stutzerimonas stutzeri]MCQ4310695.1 hypothetical protein [Stutzerimonas stutzeri]
MQFTKQSFMGIELDILVGHPEHDILFIATQVARAAGLKDPKGAVNKARRLSHYGVSLSDVLVAHSATCGIPADDQGHRLRSTTVLFTERETYEMLARGNAPQSQPFRDWVFGEVLPSIRKKGSYNVNESTTKEGMQFSGEFAALHAKINGLEAMLKELLGRPVAGAAEPSPYEGTTMSSLSDNLLFDRRTFREVGESIGLVRPGIDKLEPYVLPVT